MKITIISLSVFVLSLIACNNQHATQYVESNSNQDSTTIVKEVTGIAVDGAMNSILIRTTAGDSISFGYPELPTSKRYGWMIGDTVTVKYITDNGQDSVLSLSKGVLQ